MVSNFTLRRISTTAAAGVALIWATSFAGAESIVFEDSFEDRFIGDPPGIPPWTNISHGEGRGIIQVIADSDNRFQAGTSNQVLEWRKDGSGGALALQALEIFDPLPENEVMTFSFDFIEAGAPGFGDWVSLFVYSGQRLTANRAQRILIGRGSVGNASYPQGMLVRADIIVNNGNDPVTHTFRGQEHTVQPGTFQTWFNGALASVEFARDNNQRGPITDFELNSSTNDQVLAWFDNFTVRNEPFVRDLEPLPVLFHDAFSDHLVDEAPGGPWTALSGAAEGVGSVLVRQDSEELFGKGPGNQYMEYLGIGDTAPMSLRALGVLAGPGESEVVTVSFLLHEPEDAPQGGIDLFLYAGDRAVANRAQRVIVGNGAVGGAAYARGSTHQIDVVVNNSNDTETYADGTIQPGTFDVWINGELAFAGQERDHEKKGVIEGFELAKSTPQTMEVYFDDFIVRNFAHVTGLEAETGFENWLAEHFTPAERDDPEFGGPFGDADGDGLFNVVEYALGGNPRVASRDLLPAPEIVDVEGELYLSVEFTRPADRADVTVIPEVSSNLVDWFSGESHAIVEETDNMDGTVTVTARDALAIDAEEGRRFIRLRVVLD